MLMPQGGKLIPEKEKVCAPVPPSGAPRAAVTKSQTLPLLEAGCQIAITNSFSWSGRCVCVCPCMNMYLYVHVHVCVQRV